MKNPIPSITSWFSRSYASTRSFISSIGNRHAEMETFKRNYASAWLRGRGENGGGLAMLSSAYLQSTWVYSCISTLAETVSAVPFRIVQSPSSASSVRASSSTVDQVASLFDAPHPEIDKFQFWELVVSWLMLRGEVFILPLLDSATVASSRGPINHLLVLNPDCFEQVIVAHQLAGWRYNAPGSDTSPLASRVLLPEEVVRIKLPHPFHFWRGMSPISVAWLAAQTDYAASQFMKGVMLNNADTGLIVSTPDQLSAEQIEEVSAALRERKRSAGAADRPLFLWGGARVEKPTISTADLQFLENRKFNRQEICAIFKVPQELLGYTEDANRSVSDAMRLNFMENRIAPLCKRLEAGIAPIIKRVTSSSSSFSSSSSLRGEFHIKGTPIMQAAQRARIDSAMKLFNLGVPVNAINENLDLGLPELPHGQTCYLPVNIQTVGHQPRPRRVITAPTSNDPVERAFHALERWQEQLREQRETQALPPPPINNQVLTDSHQRVTIEINIRQPDDLGDRQTKSK